MSLSLVAARSVTLESFISFTSLTTLSSLASTLAHLAELRAIAIMNGITMMASTERPTPNHSVFITPPQ